MLKIFKINNPIIYILIIIVLVSMWMPKIMNPAVFQYDLSNVNPLSVFYNFYSFIKNYYWLEITLSLILILIQAFSLNQIIKDKDISPQNSYIPVFLYVLFVSSFGDLLVLNPVLIANTVILVSLNKIFNFYENENILTVFNVATFISIASIFYFPFALMLFLILISIGVYRLLHWRIFVVSIMGFLLPYVFLFCYYFWFEQVELFVKYFIQFDITFTFEIISLQKEFLYVSMFLLLLVIVSIFKILLEQQEKKIKIRKRYVILIWMFLLSIGSLFISKHSSYSKYIVFSIPVTVFFTNYLLLIKNKWISEFVFLCLISIFIYLKIVSL